MNDLEAARFESKLSKHSSELFQLIVRFALNTAARRGEILRLERADVSLKRRLVIFVTPRMVRIASCRKALIVPTANLL